MYSIADIVGLSLTQISDILSEILFIILFGISSSARNIMSASYVCHHPIQSFEYRYLLQLGRVIL